MNKNDLYTNIKQIATQFNLDPGEKKQYTYLKVSPQIYVICAFLTGSPKPNYKKHGSQNPHTRVQNLQNFYNTQEYIKEQQEAKSCVVQKPSIEYWKKQLQQIKDKKVENIITQLEQALTNDMIVIINENLKEEEINKILLHEYIHILLLHNKLNPKSWEKREGLVLCLQYWNKDIQNMPEDTPNEGWNMCIKEAKKWYELLHKKIQKKDRNYLKLNVNIRHLEVLFISTKSICKLFNGK